MIGVPKLVLVVKPLASLGPVTVPVAAQHIINIEVGYGAGSNSHAFNPYGVRRQADGMGLINRGLGFLTSGRVGKYWVAFAQGLLDCAAMDILQLTPAQLREAASLKERIDELERELAFLLGTSATATPSRKLHWTQTPAGRAKLARSVRRSWRTRRRSLKPTATSPGRTGKRLHWTQTPAGRAKLARAIRRSWRTRRRS